MGHSTSDRLKKWFHYYVESGIPVVTITVPGGITQAIDENANKYAILMIANNKLSTVETSAKPMPLLFLHPYAKIRIGGRNFNIL